MVQAALFAGVFGTAAAIVYFQLRHWAFAAVAAFVPLCALAATLASSSFSAAVMHTAGSAYLFGAGSLLLLGERIVRGICAGLAPRTAVLGMLRARGAAVALAAAAPVLAMLLGAALDPVWRREYASSALLFAWMLAIVLAVSWFSRWFGYSETFIARANLARERRERLFDRLAPVAETRWGFSVTGIALIFVTLAVFAIRGDQLVWWDVWSIVCAFGTAGLAFAAFLAVTRDWRLAVAATLAFGSEAALLQWSLLPELPADGPIQFVQLLGALAVAVAPFGVVAASLGRLLREGDDLASACVRTLRELGGAVTALAAIAALPGLATAGGSRFLPPMLVLFIATPPAVLLVLPALAVTIYTILPRYVSIEDALNRR
jgi:hypothetical protein